jgi:hypothetical protein
VPEASANVGLDLALVPPGFPPRLAVRPGDLFSYRQSSSITNQESENRPQVPVPEQLSFWPDSHREEHSILDLHLPFHQWALRSKQRHQ